MPSYPRPWRNTGRETRSFTGRVPSRRRTVSFPAFAIGWAAPGEGERIDGPCKPEGIAVELADVILRTLDLMAALGVDVDAVVMAKHKYNLGREYRHGDKTV